MALLDLFTQHCLDHRIDAIYDQTIWFWQKKKISPSRIRNSQSGARP